MKIYLCAISNIESGTCNEDCKFCTQSVKYQTNIQRYKKKDISQIVYEAIQAYKHKAVGFCLVTAGVGLDDKRLDYVCNVAYEVHKKVPNISLIACNGLATKEQLNELKKVGIKNYNHNLETSKEFYPNICKTHSWEDRYITCENVNSVGLKLCVGGIFGLGEQQADRISMLKSIKSLNPMSVPLNFYHPNPSLPLPNKTIDINEGLNLIQLSRKILGQEVMIMVAGGREITFKNKQYDIFKYGANSIIIGNYLTTAGNKAIEDLLQLDRLNYEIATNC